MSRVHTLRSISEDMNRDKRTVQAWYQRAKSEYGELGELMDGTRWFNDEERSILVRYVGVDRPSSSTPQVTVETGNHRVVLATPELPQTYTLEGLRVSEAIAFDDPLAIAEQFLQTADLLTSAMQSDIDQREHRLKQTKQAQSKIAAKANELKLEQRLYRERASMLDSAISEESQTLQTALSQLQSLGKSIES